MLKVLLVDDKYIVRQCLRECIAWEENGFCIVGEASGGKAAFEMCQTHCPDIIITDICMPSIDGLELIRMIQEIKPEIEFLILSGYDKFEYARTAMKLGVTAYLLKPVKNEDLLSEMLRLKEKITGKKKLSGSMGNSDRLKRELFLLEFINTPEFLDAEHCSRLLDKYGLKFPSQSYITLNIRPANSFESGTSYNMKYIQTLLYDSYKDIFVCQLDKDSLLVLIFLGGTDCNAVTEKMELLKKEVSFEFVYGLSPACNDIGNFSCQKNSAVKAALEKVRKAEPSLKENSMAPPFSTADISLLISACRSRNLAAAEKIYHSYFDRLRAMTVLDLDSVKSRIKPLILSLAYALSEDTEILSGILENADTSTEDMMQLTTLNEIENWCRSFTSGIMKCNKKYSLYVEKIISYIHNHYSEQIALNEAAEHFYMSPQHLLRILKKETGKTFTTLLTEYRMAKADELLKTGRYKIYEVCEMVGYHDPAYFGKLYKKTTGKNPSHYISPGEQE